MCSSMRVILPETTERLIGSVGVSHAASNARFRGHPTLWLLHGLSDDESIWTRSTSIKRYVAPLGLSVVMPNVHRSFYTSMNSGYRYWDFVSQELLDKARAFFQLSSVREDNFVAGLSMGGYGALKLAFTLPEQFAAAASSSGVTDVTEWGENGDEDFQLVFGKGGPKPGSQHDLFELATSLASSGRPKPRLYQCCGTEDPLYAQNIRFRDAVQDLGFDYLYEEGPGEHSWEYWDKAIAPVLTWLEQGS